MKTLLSILLLLLVVGCSQPDKPTIDLYPAIQRGDIDQIERHIHWGSDINTVDVDGNRPLHVASSQGRYVITKLLLKHGAEIDALDRNGHSALHRALMRGRTKVAELLIQQGAMFDADQLLDEVVYNNVADRDVIAFLLAQGADSNHLNPAGFTPLAEAVNREQRVLVKLLIAAGSDINRPTGEGRTPLDLAIQRNNPDIIRLLERNGAKTSPKP